MLISAGVIIVYFGFILLVAFGKDVMGARLHPGLSLGILLGAFVILATWSLTWLYVLWANRHVDTVVLGLDGGGE